MPIGITYIRALKGQDPITRGDWIKAAAYTASFAVVGVPGPNLVGHDKNSPHAFEPRQMGRYDATFA